MGFILPLIVLMAKGLVVDLDSTRWIRWEILARLGWFVRLFKYLHLRCKVPWLRWSGAAAVVVCGCCGRFHTYLALSTVARGLPTSARRSTHKCPIYLIGGRHCMSRGRIIKSARKTPPPRRLRITSAQLRFTSKTLQIVSYL